jgi:hypothetical protein
MNTVPNRHGDRIYIRGWDHTVRLDDVCAVGFKCPRCKNVLDEESLIAGHHVMFNLAKPIVCLNCSIVIHAQYVCSRCKATSYEIRIYDAMWVSCCD